MTEQGIIQWIEEASASVEQKTKAEWTAKSNHSKLVYAKGPKYFAVRIQQVDEPDPTRNNSSYCFIDYEGNIYKAAGRRPAKGIRGHITKKLANTVGSSTGWLYK